MQRNRLAEAGVPLTPRGMREFGPYFTAELLESVRLVVADKLPIPDAPFEAALRKIGADIPSPQSVAGITFDHVVAVREQDLTSRLLFHEFVHVVQYRMLGIREFARQYVQGFLAEGSYDRIPLERCAWALEERFAAKREPFSVQHAVASWMERDAGVE